ncbi:MAG TPA: hypothetical protein VFA07_01985 [Chthonomonadaceae bacterium]|nr:hypothetical protein [Chthonomonadaceae bacterium]
MSEPAFDLHRLTQTEETTLRKRFEELTAQWRAATRFLSSTTAIAMHPAYQQIIGMGPAALPFILRELDQGSDHWYWALSCITGANPVPPEQKGQHQKMREAWLQWAREQGYTW